MTHYDPNTDPTRVPPAGTPVHTETTTETVVVRDSNTGWWIAGILGALVVLAVLWILFANRAEPQTDALLEAQLDAATAQAQADNAVIQGQVAGAQASVDIARADAARSQADAVRAASEARAAEARAAEPVVIGREVPVPAPAVVTPTAPQN